MARCQACGKKGLFLRVNDFGRCKACEESYQKVEKERLRLEHEKYVTFENEKLNSQEKENLFPCSLHSYVVTDIETSGLDSAINSIIEISAIKILDNKIVGEYSSLIHRDGNLNQQITDLTGITTAMLKECPKTLETVIQEYSEFIGNYPLIGHNIDKFDFSFINKAYQQVLNRPLQNKTVDTLTLARKYIRDSGNYKLQTLAAYLHLPTDNAHRALSDCKTTMELYKSICKNFEELRLKKEKVKSELVNLDSEDGQIISLIQTIFHNIDHSYIRYTKAGKYLRFKCYYDIFRIKTSGRLKNYIVFANKFECDILNRINLETAPTSSADGGSTTRILFKDANEFLQLTDIIIDVYEKQKDEINEYIDMEQKHQNQYSNGLFTISYNYEPHFEKDVKHYLEDPELFEI